MDWPFPPPKDAFQIEGHVRDRLGRPVAGAEITALRWMDSTSCTVQTMTKFDGWFSLGPLLRNEDYEICVAPMLDAGWTLRTQLRVASDEVPGTMELEVEIGGTIVIRFNALRVLAGDLEVRLLRADGTVAASQIHKGLPLENYDLQEFGETWGFVESFRGLVPGTYRLEASHKEGPLPGTPLTVIVSATEPVHLDIGERNPPAHPFDVLTEDEDSRES